MNIRCLILGHDFELKVVAGLIAEVGMAKCRRCWTKKIVCGRELGVLREKLRVRRDKEEKDERSKP